MTDQDNHSHLDPQKEVFLKIIQEKIASKLEKLEKNSEAQDSCLHSLKTEVDGLIETGIGVATEVEEKVDKQHKATEINLVSNEQSSVSPGKKVPFTKTETKMTPLDKSEHGEQPLKKNDKKVGVNVDTSKSGKTEKITTTGKKTPTETKKSPTIHITKGKDEKEEEKRESGELTRQTEASKGNEIIEGKNEVDQEEEKEDIDVQPLEEGNTQTNVENYRRFIERIELKDLQYVRSLPNPPTKVVKVMEIVCILLGEQKVDWAHIKALLTHPKELIERMRALDVRMVPDKTYKKAKIMLNEDGMDIESLSKIGKAILYIAKWADAIITYKESLQAVDP